MPGLPPFSTSIPAGEVRGYIDSVPGLLLIAVIGHVVVEIDSVGDSTVLEGFVGGDGPVTIAHNNASPPDVVISTNNGLFVLKSGVVSNYSTGVATGDFTPAMLPIINSVSFLDGYFILTSLLGVIYTSNLNSTDVSALSFTTAEAKPDVLLRGIVYGQQSFACGAETIEVYADAATIPFPLAPTYVIPIGIISQWAIAGYEDGWGGPLIFVAQNGSVQQLTGYTPARISSDDLEALIAKVVDKTTLRASVYTFGGNVIWSLSSPNWTWEYNVTTGSWNERESYGRTRWKAGATINAFDTWVAADIGGGVLYTIDADGRIEGSDPLIWGMDSGAAKNFPIRIAVPQVYFDFVLGQAMIGDDPLVMLSWSHDGGHTWANPITRSVGRQGDARGRVAVSRIGLTSPSGVRFRFRVSDPNYTSFAGARADMVPRR